MAERLRALLEHPLDVRVAFAVLALAGAVSLGFAALVVVAGIAGPRVHPSVGGTLHGGSGTASGRPAPRQVADPHSEHSVRRVARPGQDPQDHHGSAAAARAERELASHRALQHLPYRGEDFTVRLVGAEGARAVLKVQARTVGAAHRGWHAFLHRFSDGGRAYMPRFEASGGRRG